MLMSKRLQKKSGFTMIELLAVVTIMAILFTIGIVAYTNAVRNSRDNRRVTDISNMRQALVLFRSDTGCYPDDFADLLGSDGYWSEPQQPLDPSTGMSYTYTPSGTCATGHSGFTITANMENTSTYPGGTYSVTNP
ncbi:MAG TPA: type II secretion system protein [Candidatus Woesebacteria bacterium]|nr:type II secretion system protein [Candidatus Woesebacteria bacterium]